MSDHHDNTNTGAIYPNADGTWSGFIMTDSTTRAYAEIEGAKLIIRPFLKDGKTPGKKPLASTRIVRRDRASQRTSRYRENGQVGTAGSVEHRWGTS